MVFNKNTDLVMFLWFQVFFGLDSWSTLTDFGNILVQCQCSIISSLLHEDLLQIENDGYLQSFISSTRTNGICSVKV